MHDSGPDPIRRAAARRPLEIGRQVWMGRMAFEGMSGVAQDYGEARQWFERAARWGHGEALSMLGVMALHGLGEPRDPAKAVELCRGAAGRGYAKADAKTQAWLGGLLLDGKALPADAEEARE